MHQNIKERLLKNWNFTRLLYLVLGVAIVVNDIFNHQWFGVIIGGYLASMGLFSFGCASGNCGVNFNNYKIQNNNTSKESVVFEEIKQK